MHEESFLPDTGWSLKDLTSLLFKIFCHGGLGLDIEKITHELQCHIRYDLVQPKLSWRVWGRPFLNQWHTRGISGTNGTNGCFKKNERLLSTRSVCHNSAPPLCTLLSHSLSSVTTPNFSWSPLIFFSATVFWIHTPASNLPCLPSYFTVSPLSSTLIEISYGVDFQNRPGCTATVHDWWW